MKCALLAWFAEIRAGAALGRCMRQQKLGRLEGALSTAKHGRSVLRPYPSHDGASPLHAMLTVHVETLAQRLDVPRASLANLEATIDVLKIEESDAKGEEYLAWVPYMEGRLNRQRHA
jgi:hypothetical protein